MTKIAVVHIENIYNIRLNSIGLYLKGIISRNNSKNRKLFFYYFGPKKYNKTRNYPNFQYRDFFSFYGAPRKKFKILPFSLKIIYQLFLKKKELIDFDIVWLHHYLFLLSFIFFKNHPKIILTVHGLPGWDFLPLISKPLKSFLGFTIKKFFFQYCLKIIFVSEEALVWHKHYFPEHQSKFVFQPTFFENKNFYPLNRQKAKAAIGCENKTVFIYTGRLIVSKRIDDSIKIFFEYYKKNANSVFLIIGKGKRKQKLIKLTDTLKLNQSVIFIPYMDNRKLSLYYNAADIFLITSEGEGKPISCLESMACGTPVLSAASPGMISLIKNNVNGYLFDYHHYQKNILKIIEKIINNKKIRQTTNQFAYKKYSADIVVKKILNLLSK